MEAPLSSRIFLQVSSVGKCQLNWRHQRGNMSVCVGCPLMDGSRPHETASHVTETAESAFTTCYPWNVSRFTTWPAHHADTDNCLCPFFQCLQSTLWRGYASSAVSFIFLIWWSICTWVFTVRQMPEGASSSICSLFGTFQPTTKLFLDGKFVESQTKDWLDLHNPVGRSCPHWDSSLSGGGSHHQLRHCSQSSLIMAMSSRVPVVMLFFSEPSKLGVEGDQWGDHASANVHTGRNAGSCGLLQKGVPILVANNSTHTAVSHVQIPEPYQGKLGELWILFQRVTYVGHLAVVAVVVVVTSPLPGAWLRGLDADYKHPCVLYQEQKKNSHFTKSGICCF